MFGTYPKCSPDNYVNIIQYLPTPCISLSCPGITLRASSVSSLPTRCLTTHRPILVVQRRAEHEPNDRTVTYSIYTKPTKVGACHASSSSFTINALFVGVSKKKASIGWTREQQRCWCLGNGILVLVWYSIINRLPSASCLEWKRAGKECILKIAKITTHTFFIDGKHFDE